MDYLKIKKKYNQISWSLIILGLTFSLFQIFEWLFIDYFSDIGLKGKLGKFILYVSFFFIGTLTKFNFKYSIKLLKIVAIGLLVERTVILILFSEHLFLPFIIFEIIIGLVYIWLSDEKEFEFLRLNKEQLTTT